MLHVPGGITSIVYRVAIAQPERDTNVLGGIWGGTSTLASLLRPDPEAHSAYALHALHLDLQV